MDTRQEKGLTLARDKRIHHVAGPTWVCPSQTQGDGAYIVNTQAATCTCPDHETRRVKCKHQWAVELSQMIETAPDGSQVVTESIKVTRKTYSQDWPSYNAAQCEEKETVQQLLRGLCDGIQTPAHTGRGPKPIPLSDAVFGMAMKVYSTASGRRATTDLEACADAGHMRMSPAASEGPTFTSITGDQGPTRWRGDGSSRCPLARGRGRASAATVAAARG